jgi:hypothetical protein
MTSRARLREAAVIAAQVAALGEAAARPAGEFERGALAALRWLLEGGPGPVSGEIGRHPATSRVIVQELAAAEAVIYGATTDRTDYARGVEHALMWAQFVTCATPAGIPGSWGGVESA